MSGDKGTTPPPPPKPGMMITVAPASISLHISTANKFTVKTSGLTDSSVKWLVEGIEGGDDTVGKISGGMYTAPKEIPAKNPLKVQVVSKVYGQLIATSLVTIAPPAPVISVISPASIQTPASFTLTINGKNFTNGAFVMWGDTKLATTFVSSTQLTAQGTQSSRVPVMAVLVTNPEEGSGSSNTINVGCDPASAITPIGAGRLLQQATWGPTANTLTAAQNLGFQRFLDAQFNAPMTTYPAPTKDSSIGQLQQFFFNYALGNEDQLRQRVAFAISQIMVASSNKVNSASAFTLWQNMLQKDAFGNYYDLLKDVTLSPVMGKYLDMVNNDKPNATTGSHPNENYAREILQLFSIGLSQLNSDGTLQVDGSGNPIPTYGQDEITGFAHVFTGWTYPTSSGTGNFPNGENYSGPMVAFNNHHDTGAKLLLNGATISAGGTAQSDLDAALQNIFNHPNVGPFFCKQLIQHLVTSNPSPEYVSRIAGVFANNGSGVRGDLKAVVSAILLDPEARAGDDPAHAGPTDGHLKEPVLLMTNLLRALQTTSTGDGFTDYASDLKQTPLTPPSVFNFYHPGFEIPGTDVTGPEFELLDGTTAIGRANFVNDAVYSKIGQTMTTDISQYVALASTPDQMVDRLAQIFMPGQMSADMRNSIITAISGITDNTKRTKAAIYLIATSSQFQVER